MRERDEAGDGDPRSLDPAAADGDEDRERLILAQRMALLGRVAPGLIHDLNNPLAAIVAFGHLVASDPRLPAELQREAGLVVGEADRLRRLVTGVLQFARTRPPERQVTRLELVVGAVLDLLAPTLRAAGVDVVLHLAADLAPVSIDRSRVFQVVANLVLVAAEPSSPGKVHRAVTIAAEDARTPDRPIVRLSIEATGPAPAPAADLAAAVSRWIVEDHDGKLVVAEQPGGGWSAVLELQAELADRDTAQDQKPAGRREDRLGLPPSGSGTGRVLVLDDEPAIRRFLEKVLAGSGFEPILAAGADDALRILARTDVDVVLCDQRLSGRSGTEVYEAAVATRPELATRFVLMSGDIDNPELREYESSRGVALLAKPFDIETVADTVRRIAALRNATSP